LLVVNVSVFGVALMSALLHYYEEKRITDKLKDRSTNKVEYAVDFSTVKFNTTFDAIVEHSVPPSSCLVFWYTDMVHAKQALKSGIPATPLKGDLKSLSSLLGQRSGGIASRLNSNDVGGVVVTLNSPALLDETDMQYFKVREVVLACSVPRRWLTSVNAIDGGGSGIRVISSFSMQAIRGNYYGQIDDSRPWFNGGIFLPPKAIRRAYQLIDVENSEAGEVVTGGGGEAEEVMKVVFSYAWVFFVESSFCRILNVLQLFCS
jgi:hypothetical protein